MNEPAGIYRNNSREQHPEKHYLSVQLKGLHPNTFCIGAKAFVFSNHSVMYRELQPERGFLSSSEPLLHFGLGKINVVDSLVIIWPNNTTEKITHIAADQKLVLQYNRHNVDTILNQYQFINSILNDTQKVAFREINNLSGVNFKYNQNSELNDNPPVIPQKLSGPALAVGDVNGDGLEDFFVGGGKGQTATIYLQQNDGSFRRTPDSAAFVKDKVDEDADAVFFDADGDKDLDLCVVGEDNKFSNGSPLLKISLYINDGKGNFSKSDSLPEMIGNTPVIRAADYDNDTDNDIFVAGGAKVNGSKTGYSYLLRNDGKGHFEDVTKKVLPQVEQMGLITDAAWIDVDNDGWKDLIVIGQWMEPVLFKNDHGKFKQQKLTGNDEPLKGCWRSIKCADINGDGFPDILLGNIGLNSKLTASDDFPLKMYLSDIDNNQSKDEIIAVAKNGKYYPFATTRELEKELPYLKNKYKTYREIAGKTIDEIFGDQLKKAEAFEATTLASVVLINNRKGEFVPKNLPPALQWTPINAFVINDFNKDGKKDLIAGGNDYEIPPYEGRYDAMPLILGQGDGSGDFKPVLPLPETFDKINGEITNIQLIHLADHHEGLLITIHNQQVILLECLYGLK
jgi:hypothetical protein